MQANTKGSARIMCEWRLAPHPHPCAKQSPHHIRHTASTLEFDSRTTLLLHAWCLWLLLLGQGAHCTSCRVSVALQRPQQGKMLLQLQPKQWCYKCSLPILLPLHTASL
jgi:hypothetical protein